MKKISKLLSVLLIICLCIGFTGCESKEEKCVENGGHFFEEKEKIEATCTKNGKITYKCSKCGAKDEKTTSAKGHRYQQDKIIKEATCTENGEKERQCSSCGEIEKSVIEASHKWEEATCVTPKTCTVCGATEGEKSANHTWKAATCVTPKTCTVCGTTEVEKSANHKWKAATCVTPKTCSICGTTEGEKSSTHSFSNDVCTVCGTKSTRTISCGNVNFEVPVGAVTCKYGDTVDEITITDIKFERAWDSYSSFYVYFKTVCKSGSGSLYFNYKLYDSNGNVVSTGSGGTKNLSFGETSPSDSFQINLQHVNGSDLTPGSTYKIKIQSEK